MVGPDFRPQDGHRSDRLFHDRSLLFGPLKRTPETSGWGRSGVADRDGLTRLRTISGFSSTISSSHAVLHFLGLDPVLGGSMARRQDGMCPTQKSESK